jgi:formate dehydrogenase subunit gamma
MINFNLVDPEAAALKILSFFLFLFLTIAPPLAFSQSSDARDGTAVEGTSYIHPGSELWNNVRQRTFADKTTQVKSTDSNILINLTGETWRQFRMSELIPIGGIAIIVGLVGVLLFRLIRGNIKIEGGRSDKKILRFSISQRTVHWAVAIMFVILAFTGLLLLFGRLVIIPLMGNEAFSYIAVTAKFIHDYLSPLFAVSLVAMFIIFAKENIPSLKEDINWVLKGGGLFGKHVSADRYNAGEKGWFWLASIIGGAIIVSGLVLLFPIFDQTRATMEWYHVIHSIAAISMIVGSIGHIYMGTAAMEGTFEVMKTGYCDSNWAKSHHDLWYEKVKDKEVSNR